MSAQTLLHYSQSGQGEPLVILHGLFGSSKNWQSLAKKFADYFTVYTVDLRNHGASFHDSEMNYSSMAADVDRLLQHLDIASCRLLGHSMGGKVAMTLAQIKPQLVSKMVIADIAPVSYQHHHHQLLEPIMALQLDQFESRAAIDQALQKDIEVSMLRGFLMQNLYRDNESGLWSWKVNWSAISENMSRLIGFEEPAGDWLVDIPALFVRGEKSDYIDEAGTSAIQQHFSHFEIKTLPGAGHWLHAEQPAKFFDSVAEFLRQTEGALS